MIMTVFQLHVQKIQQDLLYSEITNFTDVKRIPIINIDGINSLQQVLATNNEHTYHVVL